MAKKEKKQKTRKQKIVGWSVFGGIVVALALFLFVWYFGITYPQFDSISRKEFSICGLSDGLCPQGLCTLPENEGGYDFAMCGYIKGKPSRVYLIDSEKDESIYFTVKLDGREVTYHFGGMTATEENLYITGGSRLLRIPLEDVWAAKDGESLNVVDAFETGLGNAFVTTDGTYLYAGEFYRPGNYETDPSHHIEVTGGKNYAHIYAFRVDESKPFGVADTQAEFAISVREQVQGMAIYEGGIVLSTSWGLSPSRLFVYDNVVGSATDKTTVHSGKTIPMYVLDSSNLVKEIVSPSMSEEVCVSDGRLYVQFESASGIYQYATHTRYRNVYSVALEDLK